MVEIADAVGSYTSPEIHKPVHIVAKAPLLATFNVYYKGIVVDKHSVVLRRLHRKLPYPQIHSPNSNRFFLK